MSNYNDYGHGHFGTDIDGHCNVCGGIDGKHYPTEDYPSYGGNGSSGASLGAQFVFYIFVAFGIFIGALCPPIGALIVIIGAAITKY